MDNTSFLINVDPAAASAQQIISLEEAKANAKIDYSEEDTLLQSYVDAVQVYVENYTGRYFLGRTARVSYKGWVKTMPLPLDVVASVTAINYYDEQDAQQVLDVSKYKLYQNGPYSSFIVFSDDLPELSTEGTRLYPIEIELAIGYATADMPADLKQAALLLFGAAEVYREDMPVKPNTSAKVLLKPHKKY